MQVYRRAWYTHAPAGLQTGKAWTLVRTVVGLYSIQFLACGSVSRNLAHKPVQHSISVMHCNHNINKIIGHINKIEVNIYLVAFFCLKKTQSVD